MNVKSEAWQSSQKANAFSDIGKHRTEKYFRNICWLQREGNEQTRPALQKRRSAIKNINR
jgi:hypothetical protein